MENETLRAGDPVSPLVERYADTVLRLSFAYLRSLPDAEDAAQTVFLKVCRGAPHFENGEHERAWVIRVTVNVCKDILRSPWRRRMLPLEGTDIPAEDGEVIHLYYFENYKTSEIAQLIRKNEGTVRTRLMRARELLRSELGEDF